MLSLVELSNKTVKARMNSITIDSQIIDGDEKILIEALIKFSSGVQSIVLKIQIEKLKLKKTKYKIGYFEYFWNEIKESNSKYQNLS